MNVFKNHPDLVFAFSKIKDGNMSFFKSEADKILENRKKFLASLGLDFNSVVNVELENNIKIKCIDSSDLGKITPKGNFIKTDGLLTNQRDVYLFMVIADCLALAFYDLKHQTIGLIHVSRINLEKEIIKEAVKSMEINFNSKPQDLLVEFSPSIGPCCYKPFISNESGVKLRNYLKDDSLDIWSWAKDQLKEAGLLSENIHNSQVCTYCSGEYFSHKRYLNENLENDFRFAAVFGLKK